MPTNSVAESLNIKLPLDMEYFLGIEELELGRVSLIASIFFTHFFQYGNDAVDVRIAFPRDHCMRWVETKVTLLVLSDL